MRFYRGALLGVLCMLALSPAAFGQVAGPDAALAASVAAAQKQYVAAFTAHPQLYNGPEYLDYAKAYHSQEGHPFFLTPTKQPGSVYYNDHYFTGLQLVYDIVLDQVVLSPPYSPLTLRLINENVRFFSLNDHRFVRLVADSSAGKVIQTGFYEMLLDGPVQVLARRAKRMQERVAQSAINVEFTQSDRLFMKKAGVYYAIHNKSGALRLFSDRSKEVQDYIKAQKLSLHKGQLEASLVQLAQYYSSLSPR